MYCSGTCLKWAASFAWQSRMTIQNKKILLTYLCVNLSSWAELGPLHPLWPSCLNISVSFTFFKAFFSDHEIQIELILKVGVLTFGWMLLNWTTICCIIKTQDATCFKEEYLGNIKLICTFISRPFFASLLNRNGDIALDEHIWHLWSILHKLLQNIAAAFTELLGKFKLWILLCCVVENHSIFKRDMRLAWSWACMQHCSSSASVLGSILQLVDEFFACYLFKVILNFLLVGNGRALNTIHNHEKCNRSGRRCHWWLPQPTV